MEKQGFQVLQRNFRCRQGEIDIVGIHEGCLVFVEVKYRRSMVSGMPEEAVGVKKQEKICKTSDYFRAGHRQYDRLQIRYDVAAVLPNGEVRWHKNAFPYQNRGKTVRW